MLPILFHTYPSGQPYMNIIICSEFVSNEEASNSFLFGVFSLVYETVKYRLPLLCKHFIWYIFIFWSLSLAIPPPPIPSPTQPPFFWKQRDFAEGEVSLCSNFPRYLVGPPCMSEQTDTLLVVVFSYKTCNYCSIPSRW